MVPKVTTVAVLVGGFQLDTSSGHLGSGLPVEKMSPSDGLKANL